MADETNNGIEQLGVEFTTQGLKEAIKDIDLFKKTLANMAKITGGSAEEVISALSKITKGSGLKKTRGEKDVKGQQLAAIREFINFAKKQDLSAITSFTKEKITLPPETDKNVFGGEWTKRIENLQTGTNTFFNTYDKGAERITEKTQKVDGVLEELSKTTQKLNLGKGVGGILGDIVSQKADERTNRLAITTKEIKDNAVITRRYLKDNEGSLYLIDTQTKNIQKNTEKAEKNTENWSKRLPKVLANIKKIPVVGGIAKIGDRIGNILTYRIIRTLLTDIRKSVGQGFNLLGQNIPQVLDSQTQLSAISTTLSVTIATFLLPALQALNNLLEPLSKDMLALANNTSLLNARAQGQDQYFRLDAEAINEYAKSLKGVNSQLTGLDKFATQSGGQLPILGAFASVTGEKAKLDELLPENIDGVADSIQTLANAITSVINGLSDMNLKTVVWVSGIVLALTSIISPINGAVVLIGGFLTLMRSDVPNAAKIGASALMILASALVGAGIALHFLKSGGNPVKALLAGAAVGAGIGAIMTGISAGIGSGINVGNINTSAAQASYSTGTGNDFARTVGGYSANAYSNAPIVVQNDVYLDKTKISTEMAGSNVNYARKYGLQN